MILGDRTFHYTSFRSPTSSRSRGSSLPDDTMILGDRTFHYTMILGDRTLP
ncbi:hypothetical protein [Nostoc sp.]|uniref:hypothetical protein n=1 Tax=Nostoc sp. TaxID=1180 RepID=UPI002FF924B6